jgi:hypothetical protein
MLPSWVNTPALRVDEIFKSERFKTQEHSDIVQACAGTVLPLPLLHYLQLALPQVGIISKDCCKALVQTFWKFYKINSNLIYINQFQKTQH